MLKKLQKMLATLLSVIMLMGCLPLDALADAVQSFEPAVDGSAGDGSVNETLPEDGGTAVIPVEDVVDKSPVFAFGANDVAPLAAIEKGDLKVTMKVSHEKEGTSYGQYYDPDERLGSWDKTTGKYKDVNGIEYAKERVWYLFMIENTTDEDLTYTVSGSFAPLSGSAVPEGLGEFNGLEFPGYSDGTLTTKGGVTTITIKAKGIIAFRTKDCYEFTEDDATSNQNDPSLVYTLTLERNSVAQTFVSTQHVNPYKDSKVATIYVQRAINDKTTYGDDETVYGFDSYHHGNNFHIETGWEIKYRVTVENGGNVDLYLKLTNAQFQVNGGSNNSLGTLEFVEVAFYDDKMPTYDESTKSLYLPVGSRVIFAPTKDGSHDQIYEIGAKDNDVTYTVSFLDEDPTTVEDLKTITKTVKGAKSNAFDELAFGYSLAIPDADFKGFTKVGENYNTGEIGYDGEEIVLVRNGATAGMGAIKYKTTALYPELTYVKVLDQEPEHREYTFLFWYDKRAVEADKRRVFPGQIVKKDASDPHSVDAIWAKIDAIGGEYVYDGTEREVKGIAFERAGELDKYDFSLIQNILDKNTVYECIIYEVDPDNPSNKREIERKTIPAGGDSVRSIDDLVDILPGQTDVGIYEYYISATLSFGGGKPDKIVDTTAKLIIHPRPVIVEVNSATVPWDGTEWTLEKANQRGFTNKSEYKNDFAEYADYAAKAEITADADVAYAMDAKAVGLVNNDKFDPSMLPFAVVYGDDGDTFEILPDEYEANIDGVDGITDQDFYKVVNEAGTVDKTGNYKFFTYPGKLTIVPAHLQIVKEIEDSESLTQDETFTFEVSQGSDAVYFDETLKRVSSDSTKAANISVTVDKNDLTGESDVYEVMVGKQYDVTELTKSGYRFKSASWTLDPADGGNSSVTSNPDLASVTLAMGQTAILTVCNVPGPSWVMHKKAYDRTVSPEVEIESNTIVKVGQEITYRIEITNTGKLDLPTMYLWDVFTVTTPEGTKRADAKLENWVLVDPSTNPRTETPFTWSGSDPYIFRLDAGKTVYIEATYTVKKGDSHLNNVATVDDDPDPDDDPEDDPDDDTPSQTEETNHDVEDPKWVVEKSAVNEKGEPRNADAPTKFGETITYTVTVTNTGNVKLDLDLTDKWTGHNGTFDKATVTIYSAEGAVVNTLEHEDHANCSFTLDVGQYAMITYDYEVSSKDLELRNTATADDDEYCVPDDPENPKDPDDPEQQPEHPEHGGMGHEDDVFIPVNPSPAYKIKKNVECDGENADTSDGGVSVKEGDTLKYEVVVTNTGNVKLEELKLDDRNTGLGDITNIAVEIFEENGDAVPDKAETDITLPYSFDLDYGQYAVFTYTYQVVASQPGKDGDRTITNTATVDPTETNKKHPEDPDYPQLEELSDDTESKVIHIDLEKVLQDGQSVPVGGWKAGAKIYFEVTVTNDGAATLYDVEVTDALEGAVFVLQSGYSGYDVVDSGRKALLTEDLEPGAENAVTLLVEYTVQEDDTFYVKNTANTKGWNKPEDEEGGDGDDDDDPSKRHPRKSVEDEDDAETAAPELKLTKKAYRYNPATEEYDIELDDETEVLVDETILYVITVSNTGRLTLNNVTMTDALTVDPLSEEGVGSLYNTDGLNWLDGDPTAAFTLYVAGSTEGPSEKVFRATYTVGATDEYLHNVVTATSDKTPEESDDTKHPVKEKPDWEVVKSASGNNPAGVGDTITYTIKVTNTGNVELDLDLTDVPVGYNGTEFSPATLEVFTEGDPNPVLDAEKSKTGLDHTSFKFQLDVHQYAVITYTYKVVATDVKLFNRVTVDDEHYCDKDPTDPEDPEDPDDPDEPIDPEDPDASGKKHRRKHEDDVTIPVVPKPSFTLDKTVVDQLGNNVDATDGGVPVVGSVEERGIEGDKLQYAFTITNTGNIELNGLVLTDDTFSADDGWIEGVNFADPDAWSIVPEDSPYTITPNADGYVTIDGLQMGAALTFTYTKTYTVDEDKEDRSIVNTVTITPDTSRKGDDPDNPDDGSYPEGTDTTEIDEPKSDTTKTLVAHIDVEKSVITDVPNAGWKVGDEVTFMIVIKNDGEVALFDIELADELVNDVIDKAYGPFGADVTVPENVDGLDANATASVPNLQPGEYAIVTVVYTMQETDIASGKTVNVATATGYTQEETPDNPDPDNPDPDNPNPGDRRRKRVSDDSEATVPQLKFEIEKVVDKPIANIGETVTYTVTLTNTGDVALSRKLKDVFKVDGEEAQLDTELELSEEDSGEGVTYVNGILTVPAGETAVLKATYVVREYADGLDKVLTNQVTPVVPGNPNDPENPDEPEDEKTTPEVETKVPHIKLVKDRTNEPANGEAYVLGELIEFTITVTNDGALDLENVVITDDKTGDVWMIDLLKVGESKTFITTYAVTGDDILVGTVYNVAVVEADNPRYKHKHKDPNDPEDPENPDDPEDPDDPDIPEKLTDEDDADAPTEEPDPHLSLVKRTVSKPANGSKYHEGETIRYQIVVTNDGNVPLKNVEVRDSLSSAAGKVIGRISRLEPGESRTFSFSHKVTAADVSRGKVINVATADADDPRHDPEDPEDPPKIPTDPSEVEDPTEPDPDPTPTPEPPEVNHITISGKKTWVDDDDSAGLRPVSITVQLRRNGEVIEEKTVTEADGWSYTFADLPETDEETGEEYVYTITEHMVGGYFSSTSGYNLVNTLIPGLPDPENPDDPKHKFPNNLTEEELERLLALFGYGTPLGWMLQTGDEIPVYPFVFGGVGIAALFALLVFGRKKRKKA